ncbi:MAG: glycosyltransferase, partial [Candidatus Fervidibacter sp.]
MPEEFIVIHAEWGRYWSGGTQQVALLLEGLWRRGVSGYLVCQEGSMLAERLSGKVPLKTFNLRGEHDLHTWYRFSKWLSVFCERQSSLNHSILVHAHSRKGALPTLLIARFQKALTILHWRVSAPMRFLSRLADIVIANSKAAAEKVIREGVNPEKVFVVRSSINTEFFKPPNGVKEQIRSHWGIDKSDFVVAGVGRLVKGKGY